MGRRFRARRESRRRTLGSKTQEGTVGLRFTPSNEYGVLDHTVVLSDGTEVYVPMRVMPNGQGSEVMLVLFRQPAMDDAEFVRDVGLIK